jgi:hypothetical protein
VPHFVKIMINSKIYGFCGTVPHFKMRHTRQNSNRRISTALVGQLFFAMKNKIFPEGVTDEEFKKYLFSVAHALRYQAKDVQAGRPPKYRRETLNTQTTILDEFLDQETAGWLKLPFFITNCVPVLWYPQDIKHALDAGKINLEEARILSLINRKNLGEKMKSNPSHIRRDLLESIFVATGLKKNYDSELMQNSEKRQKPKLNRYRVLLRLLILRQTKCWGLTRVILTTFFGRKLKILFFWRAI